MTTSKHIQAETLVMEVLSKTVQLRCSKALLREDLTDCMLADSGCEYPRPPRTTSTASGEVHEALNQG